MVNRAGCRYEELRQKAMTDVYSMLSAVGDLGPQGVLTPHSGV